MTAPGDAGRVVGHGFVACAFRLRDAGKCRWAGTDHSLCHQGVIGLPCGLPAAAHPHEFKHSGDSGWCIVCFDSEGAHPASKSPADYGEPIVNSGSKSQLKRLEAQGAGCDYVSRYAGWYCALPAGHSGCHTSPTDIETDSTPTPPTPAGEEPGGWQRSLPAPEVNLCDLCDEQARWKHPQGGLRCDACPRPDDCSLDSSDVCQTHEQPCDGEREAEMRAGLPATPEADGGKAASGPDCPRCLANCDPARHEIRYNRCWRCGEMLPSPADGSEGLRAKLAVAEGQVALVQAALAEALRKESVLLDKLERERADHREDNESRRQFLDRAFAAESALADARAEIEALRALDSSTSPCGHSACFAWSEDGGRHIVCERCMRLDHEKALADAQRQRKILSDRMAVLATRTGLYCTDHECVDACGVAHENNQRVLAERALADALLVIEALGLLADCNKLWIGHGKFTENPEAIAAYKRIIERRGK